TLRQPPTIPLSSSKRATLIVILKRGGRAARIAWRVWESQRLVISQRMRGRRFARRQGLTRQRLEIRDAGVTPPLRLALLYAEERPLFLVALRVDGAVQTVPGRAHRVHFANAARIAPHQFIPERFAVRHAVVPGEMVKPKQEFFRRGGDAGV